MYVLSFIINHGFIKQLDTWGMDGEVVQIVMPLEQEVSELVSASVKRQRTLLGSTTFRLDVLVIYLHLRVGCDEIVTVETQPILAFFFSSP